MRELTTTGEITQMEIDAINAKHTNLIKKMRKNFLEAMEIGDWFVHSATRLGVTRGRYAGGKWMEWLNEKFPNIPVRTIERYMQLAKNREFLEASFDFNSVATTELENLPTIKEAIEIIAQRNAEEKAARVTKKSKAIDIESETHSANGQKPGAELAVVTRQFSDEEHEAMSQASDYSEVQAIKDKDKKPIDILTEKLKQYAVLLWQLQASEADVREYIEAGEFKPAQIVERIHQWWDDQPQILKMMLRTFIR